MSLFVSQNAKKRTGADIPDKCTIASVIGCCCNSGTLSTLNPHHQKQCHLLCSLLLEERSFTCSLKSDSPTNIAASVTTRPTTPTPTCIAASCRNPDCIFGVTSGCLLECWFILAALDIPAHCATCSICLMLLSTVL